MNPEEPASNSVEKETLTPLDRWKNTVSGINEKINGLLTSGASGDEIFSMIWDDSAFQESRKAYLDAIEADYKPFIESCGEIRIANLKDFLIYAAKFDQFVEEHGLGGYESPVSKYDFGYRFNVDTIFGPDDPITDEEKNKLREFMLEFQPNTGGIPSAPLHPIIKDVLLNRFMGSWDDKERLVEVISYLTKKSYLQLRPWGPIIGLEGKSNELGKYMHQVYRSYVPVVSDGRLNSRLDSAVFNRMLDKLLGTGTEIDLKWHDTKKERESLFKIGEDYLEGRVNRQRKT